MTSTGCSLPMPTSTTGRRAASTAQFPDVKAWLAEVLPNFPAYVHMLGNFDVRIDGDTASSRTICFNPMVLDAEAKQVLFIGIWYDDEFVRTPDGWRMTRRVETKCFDKLV